MKRVQLRSGQRVQAERQPSILFDFLRSYDKALAGATGQQRDARVDPENLKNLPGLFEESRCDENQAKRNLGGAQSLTKILCPFLKIPFIKWPGPMSCD